MHARCSERSRCVPAHCALYSSECFRESWHFRSLCSLLVRRRRLRAHSLARPPRVMRLRPRRIMSTRATMAIMPSPYCLKPRYRRALMIVAGPSSYFG
jgi:hypothetical protein